MLLRLWNYIRGYVIVVVEGVFLEKFLNICMHRQIYLWNIIRRKGSLQTNVSIRGFKMLRPIARATRSRVRIKKKRGLPFVLVRYRKRKTFLAGIVLFFCLFYSMSMFVWTVEVSGNEKVDSETIYETLNELGIKPGVRRSSVKLDEISNEMLLRIKELSWVGVEMEGTKIRVEVAERIKAPEILDKNIPCDIIASKDGVITEIIVKEGYPKVKVGDTVRKGQLLISGTIPSKFPELPQRTVHSIGNVYARTWYESTKPLKYTTLVKNRTDKAVISLTMHFLAWNWNFYRQEVPFENYEKVAMEKKIRIGRHFDVPIYFTVEKFYEVVVTEEPVDPELAGAIAIEEASAEILASLLPETKIMNRDSRIIKLSDGTIAANVIFECLEDIGVEAGITPGVQAN